MLIKILTVCVYKLEVTNLPSMMRWDGNANFLSSIDFYEKKKDD